MVLSPSCPHGYGWGWYGWGGEQDTEPRESYVHRWHGSHWSEENGWEADEEDTRVEFWSPPSGNATHGADYDVPLSVTVPGSETSAPFELSVVDDAEAEPTEVGSLEIMGTGGYIVVPHWGWYWGWGHGHLSIADDDWVDLDVDSNNTDGLNAPSRATQDEDEIEDNWTKPGKLVPVNDDDGDADGVPDWADGFDRYDTPEDDAPASALQGERFVPVTVTLAPGIDASAESPATITFGYAGSDPAAELRSGTGTPEDPYVYTPPAAGAMRLWTRDGASRRTADSAAGATPNVWGAPFGHYIKPGEAIDVYKLFGGGRSVTLWAEAVAASTVVQPITASFQRGGTGATLLDTVHLSILDWRPALITGSNTTVPAETVEFLSAAPRIAIPQVSLQNFQFDAAKERIFADLGVAGSLDSPVGDVTPGELGRVDRVGVSVNGEHAPSRWISVSVTKPEAAQGTLSTPFDYQGTFAATLGGIELYPGSNVIRFTATDPVTGHVGFSEWHTEVALTPPPALPEPDPMTYEGFTIAAGPVTKLSESEAGDAKFYALEVVAPAPVFDPELGLAAELADGERPVVAWLDGKHYVGAVPPAEPGGGGEPAQPRVAITHQAVQRLVERGGFVPIGDTDDFLLGVVKGIVDGPLGYIEAGKMVMEAAPFLVKHARFVATLPVAVAIAPVKLGFKIGKDPDKAIALFEKGKVIAAQVGQKAGEALLVAKEIHDGGMPLIVAVMVGDEDRLNKLSHNARVTLELAADIFVDLFTATLDVKPETLGYITGQVIYEVAEGVVTFGAAKIVTLPKVLAKLKAAKWMAGGAGAVLSPQTVAKLTKVFDDLLIWLQTTAKYSHNKLAMKVASAYRQVRKAPEYQDKPWQAFEKLLGNCLPTLHPEGKVSRSAGVPLRWD